MCERKYCHLLVTKRPSTVTRNLSKIKRTCDPCSICPTRYRVRNLVCAHSASVPEIDNSIDSRTSNEIPTRRERRSRMVNCFIVQNRPGVVTLFVTHVPFSLCNFIRSRQTTQFTKTLHDRLSPD